MNGCDKPEIVDSRYRNRVEFREWNQEFRDFVVECRYRNRVEFREIIIYL